MNIYFLTITSGFLMALSLTFDFLWPLAWIGLTPYLYIVFNYSLSKKESLKVGFLYGTTYYLVLLHWLFELYPLDNYGFNKIQSILLLFSGWIFISIYEGLWLSLVPLIFSRIKINPKINIFSFGAIWIIVEWGQQLGLLGFSWGRLAISQGKIPLLIQSASLLGSLLISFFIVSVNSCITYIFIYRKNILNIRSVYISLSSMIIFNIAYGSFNLNKNSDASKLTFAIIQGNISSSKKWTSDLEGIFKKYKDLSYEALNNAKGIYDKIDFILWPETAIPVTLNNNEKILKEYKFLASTSSAELIVGAYHEEGDNSYNSIYNISPSGKLSAPYFKRHLVPFGEYLPFENILSKLIPSLKQINLFSSNLTAGHKVNLLSSSHGKLGGLICFLNQPSLI
ncbi:apolipoprotein N-acyltransferase [Clostridium sp. LP20]|uniref:apolipoprotein N-acyltransferase n=1 Tax=Clostridium sp. LP20 TaxID=3418665 RepID=UPI003EE53589